MILLALGMVLVAATTVFAQTEEPLVEEVPPATVPVDSTVAAPDAGGVAAPATSVTIVNSLGENVIVPVEIAATDAEKQMGLMGRTSLAADAGMLFVFDSEQTLSFWMKDTLIPLSIAYIDAAGRIVDIQDMQPLDETPHPSAAPAQYALEVNQGFFATKGIQVGDLVQLPGQPSGVVPDPAPLTPEAPVSQEPAAAPTAAPSSETSSL